MMAPAVVSQKTQDFKFFSLGDYFGHNAGNMSTAILYAYLPGGFVIGADGRRTDVGSSQPIVCDDAQKIFPRKCGEMRLTFAWTGATTFAKLNMGFNDLTDSVIRDMDFSSLTTFYDFLLSFSRRMNVLLSSVFNPFGSLRPQSWDAQPPRVIFLAYFKDEPFVAELALVPNNLSLDIQKFHSCSNMDKCFSVFTGSKAAYDKFSPENEIPLFGSLHEAANQIRDYINLCFVYPDNPASINPIGGRIHIGQLRSNGFLWIDSPLL